MTLAMKISLTSATILVLVQTEIKGVWISQMNNSVPII
uniref:Fusion protein n=1 Tax=Arundo donax TaxID=35708 RepID=A0A0A9C567_ARUDO